MHNFPCPTRCLFLELYLKSELVMSSSGCRYYMQVFGSNDSRGSTDVIHWENDLFNIQPQGRFAVCLTKPSHWCFAVAEFAMWGFAQSSNVRSSSFLTPAEESAPRFKPLQLSILLSMVLTYAVPCLCPRCWNNSDRHLCAAGFVPLKRHSRCIKTRLDSGKSLIDINKLITQKIIVGFTLKCSH